MDFEELKEYYKETVNSGGVTKTSFWEEFASVLWTLEMISKEELDKFVDSLTI